MFRASYPKRSDAPARLLGHARHSDLQGWFPVLHVFTHITLVTNLSKDLFQLITSSSFICFIVFLSCFRITNSLLGYCLFQISKADTLPVLLLL